MMTAYRNLGWRIENFPNAYDYYHNLITLPLNTRLSDEDQEYIIENYTDILEHR
jgi:dTDP-4-amino-4,6-dideoxygalactose transaminase